VDPRSDKINEHLSGIESVLDAWGFTQRSAALRSEKKSQIIFWLENFLPSEIDDAFLLLSKIQYKDDHLIRRAIAVLSAELIRILGSNLADTRFFPLGLSPSSSGGMFLYDFRKELGLSETNFPSEQFDQARNAAAVVFFDDIIGSGNQAVSFFQKHLTTISTQIIYAAVFGFTDGVERVRHGTAFAHVMSGLTLSDEERAFTKNSAVFPTEDERERIRLLTEKYGRILFPQHPLGYDDSQALLVFPHNTPNNTLPVIWAGPRNEKAPGVIWNPVWERRKHVKRVPQQDDNLPEYLSSVEAAFRRWKSRYVNVVGREHVFDVPLYATETDWDIFRVLDEDGERERREGDVKSLRDSVHEKRMILLGDAGMGKTSSLQYLSFLDATENPNGRADNQRIPVYVELKLLTGETPLERVVFHKLGMLGTDAEYYLSSGRVTLYLDGLNEIMNTVRQRYWIEIGNLMAKYDQLPIVMASRPQLYRNNFPKVPCFLLQKMTGAQIQEFLFKNASTADIAKGLWLEIEGNGYLRRIVGTPLLLFMLLNVVEQSGTIPSTEGLIIREFVNGLFLREQQEKDIQFEEVEFRLLLRQLAFQGLSRKGSNAAITQDEALAILAERKGSYGLTTNLVAFLRRSEELGIIARQEEQYSFSHQLYQDYFAAEEMAVVGKQHG